MASAVIPIHKIRVDSTLTTSVSRSSALPRLVRRILVFWLFPHVLRFVVTALADRLGTLTTEEAGELYGPLNQLLLEVNKVLAKRPKWSRIERMMTVGWTKEVGTQADKLADIVESLAWGSEEGLREFIDDSLAELESCRG